jgi:hypothetical membrane protein
MELNNTETHLVLYIAKVGRIEANHAMYRHLWYRGLTVWVSPTEMSLSDLGAREANRLLYNNGVI